MGTASDNAAIVRRGYEAFAVGDFEALAEVIAEGANWHTPGRSSLAGDHLGREATFAYWRRLGGETGGSFEAVLQHLFTSDDGRVIALHRNTGERNGKRLDLECFLIFELEGDKIIDGREVFFDLYAWDDFWL